jgi:hypothetical protein
MINRHQDARPLSVPTAAQRSNAVSENRPCHMSDQLSVRTYPMLARIEQHGGGSARRTPDGERTGKALTQPAVAIGSRVSEQRQHTVAAWAAEGKEGGVRVIAPPCAKDRQVGR